MKHILSPSILAADFACLGQNIQEAAEAGAEYIHFDVMDGMFVPSISFGMPVLKSVRKIVPRAVLDVHLMVEDPDRYVEEFAALGADIITVHAEACRHLDRTLAHIRACGRKAGVALNPATPLSVLDYVWDKVDMVLIMTVNPGFGGQSYIEAMTDKISALRSKKPDLDIEVDGGINADTLLTVLDAGANVLVEGSAVFSAGDIADNVRKTLDIMRTYD